MADEKVFEDLLKEVEHLKGKHLLYANRVYNIFGLVPEDDPYSVEKLLEFKRNLDAERNSYVPVLMPKTEYERRFNPQPKPVKGGKK